MTDADQRPTAEDSAQAPVAALARGVAAPGGDVAGATGSARAPQATPSVAPAQDGVPQSKPSAVQAQDTVPQSKPAQPQDGVPQSKPGVAQAQDAVPSTAPAPSDTPSEPQATTRPGDDNPFAPPPEDAQPQQQPGPVQQPPYGQPWPPQQWGVPQPPYGAAPGQQPPNGVPQPPYGQPPYGQPPYGQPPYGQPPADGSQPPSPWGAPPSQPYGGQVRPGPAQPWGTQRPREPERPHSPWTDPNRYGPVDRRDNDPDRRYRDQREAPPRPQRDMQTRWALGLSLGATACTMLAVYQGLSTFPAWMVGAAAGLVLAVAAFVLAISAQRTAMLKHQRASEATASLISACVSGGLSTILLVVSIVWWGPFKEYAKCMQGANTQAAQNACLLQLEQRTGMSTR